jgi:hypothetical protein
VGLGQSVPALNAGWNALADVSNPPSIYGSLLPAQSYLPLFFLEIPLRASYGALKVRFCVRDLLLRTHPIALSKCIEVWFKAHPDNGGVVLRTRSWHLSILDTATLKCTRQNKSLIAAAEVVG